MRQWLDVLYRRVFMLQCFFFLVFILFLKRFYLFLERGEGRKKEKERNINVWLPLTLHQPGTWLATQACALTGNWTGDPLVCRPALNPLSHTSQVYDIVLYFNISDQSMVSSSHSWADFLHLRRTFINSSSIVTAKLKCHLIFVFLAASLKTIPMPA